MIKAVCVLKSESVNGVVYFTEHKKVTQIFGYITGLKPLKKHGFHIHEAGDLTDNCTSTCAHYNPFNKNHGGPYSKDRHVGDLGNLDADINGNCEFNIVDDLVKLTGKYSVIGRSIVIHEDEDDLGLGNYEDSLTTGHSGKRLACGVIGYSKNCK